ncbi:MAG: hypothetical protein WEG40_02320 [Candidatus Rokuibacteriota bacterium]
MIRGRFYILIGTLCGALVLSPGAHADDGWTLWERPVDLNGQALGGWQRKQVFEAERWCRGAMTSAINRTLRAGWKDGRPDPKAKMAEYQCLPEGEDARSRDR